MFTGPVEGLAKAVVLLALCLVSSTASSNCNRINNPWNNYPLLADFGAEIVIDASTPVGTPIATATLAGSQLYAPNGGWVATCSRTSDTIAYWWLEQHWSRSRGQGPIGTVSAPTSDGNMYVMQDSGRGNPYEGGSNGSGSVGYTVELMTDGQALPFAWVSANPRKNLPPIASPIHGIPCTDALQGTGQASGYPKLVGVNCPTNDYAINWRQFPPFSLKVTLYKLAGNPDISGVQLQNNGGNGFSLFSLMNNQATPPGYNTELFNLVRLRLAQNTRVRLNPCQSFADVLVNLGEVRENYFKTVGQPPSGVADTAVNITANCVANNDIKWAVTGTIDAFDPSGNQGILALDADPQQAGGVGIQLVRSDGTTPLPITPEGSAVGAYRWIDTGLRSNTSGILAFDFLARYVRTGDVSPGIANGHATVVLSPK